MDNQQLIQLITERVLAEVSRQRPAQVHPAPGLCTAGEKEPFASEAIEGEILSGVITARKIEDLNSSSVLLAPGAKLTPLAKDLLKEKNISWSIASRTESPAAPAAGSKILYWIEGKCPAVDKIEKKYASRLQKLSQVNKREQMPSVIKEISRKIGSGQVSSAVIFAPVSSLAVCYANRCSNLRAVAANYIRTLEEGIKELGANVLVIEYPPLGFSGMDPLIELFLKSPGVLPPGVGRQIQELSRCG